jgi:hypothetical protein
MRFIQVEALGPRADPAHAAARMIAPGEELRTRRSADGTDEEPFKPRAIVGNRVDVRRREIRVAVDTEIAPTLIIGEDDDEVRAAGAALCGSKRSEA